MSDELRIALEATIPNFNAQGTLGFLQVDVLDGSDLNRDKVISADEKTRLLANINIDVRDPGTGTNNDNKLTLSELSSSSPATVIAASFPNTPNTNRADVRLHLIGSVAGNQDFPQIETDFTVSWGFGASAPLPAHPSLEMCLKFGFATSKLIP